MKCLRVTVVPITGESQHLSVMIQELSQIVHLIIRPKWLHSGCFLWEQSMTVN